MEGVKPHTTLSVLAGPRPCIPSSTMKPPREPRPKKLPALGGEKAFVRTNRTGRVLGPGLWGMVELPCVLSVAEEPVSSYCKERLG